MKCKSTKTRTSRSRRGSFIADAPMALWLLFIGLTLPFLNLASITMRYTFVLAAARDGAFAASRETTYTLADAALRAKVAQTAASFTGITINPAQVRTYVVTTNIATKVSTRQPARLGAAANPTANIYSIEAEVPALIQPFINLNGMGGMLPNVPGLTSPVATTCICREYFENPQGLNQ